MPKSNGRPKNRQPKTASPHSAILCKCGGKPTKYGLCIRCLDNPLIMIHLQSQGIYLPSRKERKTGK